MTGPLGDHPDPQAGDRAPRQRWRRIALAAAVLVVLGPMGLLLAAHGASNWCTEEGFRRASGFGQEVTISAWPPGVRCNLDLDGRRAVVHWPIDW